MVRRSLRPLTLALQALLLTCTGCAADTSSGSVRGVADATDRQTAFRVRANFNAGLNADEGWAGALNENVTVNAEAPFRIRFEVESAEAVNEARRFHLQYRRNGGAWTNVEAADFPYPSKATPESASCRPRHTRTALQRRICWQDRAPRTAPEPVWVWLTRFRLWLRTAARASGSGRS